MRLGDCGYVTTRGKGTRVDEINFRESSRRDERMRNRDDILAT